MQTAVETEKKYHLQLSSEQISKLFNFEAEYSKAFSERTIVPPAIIENPAEVISQLTDDFWLIINGEKGSGKTSYLYYTRHELLTQSEIHNAIPLYVAFDSDDIKSEINSVEEKAHFLVTHFYKPLLREIAGYLNSLPRSPKQTEQTLTAMVRALGITQNDLRRLFPKEERRGFIAWLLRVLGINASDDLQDIEYVEPNLKRLPNYSEFRDALIYLTDVLGASRIYLLIDEVNEQRLSKSEQQVLFDHLYNTYRTAKQKVTIKIATTSSVQLPDFIFHGHYFMPMELSSMLLHPLGYEEMLRAIFELRLKEICSNNGIEGETTFLDFFTETSFRVLAQASMGNVREFFFLGKIAYNQSLPSGKIEFSQAQRVVRNRASELEERIKEKGGEPLYAMYLRLVSSLQERSDAKLARKKAINKGDENIALGAEQSEAGLSAPQGVPVDKVEEKEGENAGVSYFMVSNYDSLSKEDRDLLEKLEDEKIIFGTGEWKSLRRRGAKQQLYAISYLVCSLRGIKWQDVPYLVRHGIASERELIDQGRCQIAL
ncbi:MAG: hypothetical protein ACRECH_03445 [Nitrososphaerales archaeon]